MTPMTQGSPPTGELVALICERVGQDFDNEAHFSGEEAGRIADAITTLERELEEARATNRDLHRRVQFAERFRYTKREIRKSMWHFIIKWMQRAEERQRALTASQAEVERLKEALTKLVQKLDIVHADSRYEGVWTIAYLHGQSYTGPTYTDELAAARAALQVEESKT
jgi:polyhydroxyalkanoate synthesis regulator phasin